MTQKEIYQDLYEKHHNEGLDWGVCADIYNEEFKTHLTRKQIKDRIFRYHSTVIKQKNRTQASVDEKNYADNFIQHNSDGTIDARKIVEYQQDVFGNPRQLLTYLGFDPDQWEFVNYSYSVWEQRSKNLEGSTDLNNLWAVKFKVKPRADFSPSLLMKEAIRTLNGAIKPFNAQRPVLKNENFRRDTLIEFCPVELHLGKIAESIDTGEEYNVKIASSRFNYIVGSVIEYQKIERAEKCLVVIGNDFFNSEFDSMTHNKTPQQNDCRYKTLFSTGLELYRSALVELRNHFPKIDVMMCVGNHARAMEFFLYLALKEYFHNDDVFNFSDDMKDTQAYQFGDCAIFYNHGDPNLKQLIKSIPAEFYYIWGNTRFRELHLGHLHKEVTVDDESGMITRRIGSPCSTDAWHYQNRFIGAVKKHQIFIWNSSRGLQSIQYINM